jgi:hypothetical protein
MASAQTDIQDKIRTGRRAAKVTPQSDYDILDDLNVRETIDAEEIKLSSEEDLESLLKLAEDLKGRVEKHPLNFFLSLLKLLRILLIFVSIGATFLVFSDSTKLFNWVILAIVVASLIFNVSQIRELNRDLLPDKLALQEVLQLLREVHRTIAERKDWSILKRAEFRIRLSRFDLSEKKDSVFSFFS